MKKLRVITSNEEVGEILWRNSDLFPMNSTRLSALAYHLNSQGTLFSPVSLAIVSGETPLICALGSRASQEISFFGQPVRLEINEGVGAGLDWSPVFQLVASHFLAKSHFPFVFSVEIPLETSLTIPLVERFAHYAESSSIDFEAIMPLAREETELFSNLRKGHRQSLRKAQDSLPRPQTYYGAVDDFTFVSFKNLHIAAAGRQTRSDQTWGLMLDAVREERAILTTVSDEDGLIGSTFCWVSPDAAYYGTGAYDRSKFRVFPIGHLTLFQAAAALGDLGKSVLILGDAFSIGKSKKEVSIASFKRGFSSERKALVRMRLAITP